MHGISAHKFGRWGPRRLYNCALYASEFVYICFLKHEVISPTPSIVFGFLIVEDRYGFWGTYMEDLNAMQLSNGLAVACAHPKPSIYLNPNNPPQQPQTHFIMLQATFFVWFFLDVTFPNDGTHPPNSPGGRVRQPSLDHLRSFSKDGCAMRLKHRSLRSAWSYYMPCWLIFLFPANQWICWVCVDGGSAFIPDGFSKVDSLGAEFLRHGSWEVVGNLQVEKKESSSIQ